MAIYKPMTFGGKPIVLDPFKPIIVCALCGMEFFTYSEWLTHAYIHRLQVQREEPPILPTGSERDQAHE